MGKYVVNGHLCLKLTIRRIFGYTTLRENRKKTTLMRPEISVIVPCYKEAAVIENTIQTLSWYLSERFERFEIIVVTDGSPDKTKETVQHFGNTHPEIPLVLIPLTNNQGKGVAVKTGVLHSRYDPILFIDADLTIPIQELEKFLTALTTNDIVIASRLISGSHFEEPIPLYRVILARGFYFLQIILLGNLKFSDTQCGFKLFRRERALPLFQKLTVRRFAFDAELLFLAKKTNLKVAALPVTILKDPRHTNVSSLKDPINMFFALLKIRWNNWIGKYDF